MLMTGLDSADLRTFSELFNTSTVHISMNESLVGGEVWKFNTTITETPSKTVLPRCVTWERGGRGPLVSGTGLGMTLETSMPVFSTGITAASPDRRAPTGNFC